MNRVFSIPIFFFFSFIFLIYFLLPIYSDFKKLDKEIKEKERFIQEKEFYFSNLKKISEYLEKEKESLGKIETALPLQLSVADLLIFFEKKILESGLFLESISIDFSEDQIPSPEGKTQIQKKETLFSLLLRGDFFSLETFLREIERSARMIEVEKISLTLSPGSKGEILEISLLLKVYSR